MFYQLDWQQMEKSWKVICTASLHFIVTHHSRFCSLISASYCLSTRGEKRWQLRRSSVHGLFSWYSARRCVTKNRSKRAITAECPPFHQHFNARICDPTPSQNHPYLQPRPGANYQPHRRFFFSVFRGPPTALLSPYLSASPQSKDRVLFSQLTCGCCWNPPQPPLSQHRHKRSFLKCAAPHGDNPNHNGGAPGSYRWLRLEPPAHKTHSTLTLTPGTEDVL